MKKNIKVVAFFHTYARDGEFGTYTKELIKGFEQSGIELYIFKVNDLVGQLKNKHYLHKNLETYVINKILEINPDFIFTTNWAGVTTRIIEKFFNIPRVTWMVDRMPFTHNGKRRSEAFDKNDILITSSTSNITKLESKYPYLKGNVYYLPFMTNPEYFKKKYEQDINISFIGSLFQNSSVIVNLLDKYNDAELREGIFKYIKEVEKNYELNIKDTLQRCKIYDKIESNMEIETFHGVVANIISNNKRIKVLDKIAPLGLVFYGTKNWTSVIDYSTELFSKFQYETFVDTREKLSKIYNKSKISININHHQATTGQGYRVFDILASDSLLITNYQENSDLEKIFGENHPIPAYRNLDELYELCQYYLNHESERKELVKKCNSLISEKHTFKNRVKEIVKLASKQDVEFNFDYVASVKINLPEVAYCDFNNFGLKSLLRLNYKILKQYIKKIITRMLRN